MASSSPTADVLIPATQFTDENYLKHDRGILSWIFTLDHKRIGVMYLVSVLTSFLIGGLSALVIRTELLTPGKTIIDAHTYNQMFTLHGAVMVFLVIIPGIPAALGNFTLPLQLGAKDVAFLRLNLAGYHLWMLGALFLILSMVLSAADTGWTFYTPYSTTTQTAVIYLPEFQGLHQLLTLGAFILGLGFLITVVCPLVSLRKSADAAMNPWGGAGLEWKCSSPPPCYNFHQSPLVSAGPDDGYDAMRYDEKTRGYVLESSEV